jgi:hypothetical protein
LDYAPGEEGDGYWWKDDRFDGVEAAHLVRSQTKERRSHDGEEDEADELLYRDTHTLGNRVLQMMPVVAKDAAEEDRQEVPALHHQHGGPDLSDEQANGNGEEAAIHAPHDSTFNREAKVPFRSDSGVPGYGDGAEEVGDEDADDR